MSNLSVVGGGVDHGVGGLVGGLVGVVLGVLGLALVRHIHDDTAVRIVHTVGHGLDAAVGEQHAVLASHHAPITGLLLVEVVADVVLDSVAVPEHNN